jgi:hypothetical protein
MHGKSEKAFSHNVRAEMEAGKPQAQSLAIAYAMKKKKKMADGGEVSPQPTSSATVDPKKASDMASSMKKAFGYADGGEVDDDFAKAEEPPEKPAPITGAYAHGGMMDDDDLVMRIMKKRYSKGGMVANDTPITADFEKNDFDMLALDGEDFAPADETGANSGDELGDDREDEDRHDIVSRIMKSRAKKDRLPRPA